MDMAARCCKVVYDLAVWVAKAVAAGALVLLVGLVLLVWGLAWAAIGFGGCNG